MSFPNEQIQAQEIRELWEKICVLETQLEATALRKWCADAAVRAGESGEAIVAEAQRIYDWVTQKHAPEVYTK